MLYPSSRRFPRSTGGAGELCAPDPQARQEDLEQLSDAAYERIRDTIRGLAEDPRPPGCAKLTAREAWRLRVGDYRVIYEIDDAARVVAVLHVGHRRDVYP